ncbi:MAG: ThiF family adenylyltransferase [Bdellovibrionota bacterium]
MSQSLNVEELSRYDRHLRLANVGINGQVALKNARVLVIGVGGLGCPAALYLAAAGVGKLGLLDFDDVEVSNLQRQVLFRTVDEGRSKVDCASEELQALNPYIEVCVYRERLNSENVLTIFNDYDVIVDAVDNFATRYLISDGCVLANKINVHGSVQGFEGRISVLCHENGPCYRCMFPTLPRSGSIPSCSEGGVLGVVPGIIGTHMACEVIKLIIGQGSASIGSLQVIDVLNNSYGRFRLPQDPDCITCGQSPSVTDISHCLEASYIGASCDVSAEQYADSTINCSELEQMLRQNPNEMLLIDLRTAEEIVQTPMITSAVSIPLAELKEKLSIMRPQKQIIVYCRAGARGETALELLKGLGLKGAKNLAGGVLAWQSHIFIPQS